MNIFRKIDNLLESASLQMIRFAKEIPKQINRLLSQRFWNGLGVIIMIGVAIMIFVISQQWQTARYEESLANIELANVDIISPIEEIISENNTRISFIHISERAPNITPEKHEPAQSNRWLALLQFVNKGPAPAGKFIIRIVYGGEDIEPIGMPRISTKEMSGEIYRGGTTYVKPEGQDSRIYETECEITVDSLFIDSDVWIVLEFYAEDEVDMKLRNNPTYRYSSWSFYDTGIEGYTISDMEYFGIYSEVFKDFIQQINVRGQYIKQTWDWKYPTLLFGEMIK